MLVALTRAGGGAAIVETETIELDHAAEQRDKVREIEQCLLQFKATRDDQEMMVDDVELVEQGDVGLGDIGDKKVRVVRKERVRPATVRRLGLANLLVLILAGQTRYLADKETHATVFDRRADCLDRKQCATIQRMRRLAEYRGPQGAANVRWTHKPAPDPSR